MSSKPSLSALMKRAAHGPVPEVQTTPAPAPVAAPAPIALVAPAPVPAALPQPTPIQPPALEPKQAGRGNKKPLSVWVTPEARRTLKQLAAEQDRTIESLIGEGLNDLFQKYQKPRLA